MLQGRGHTDDLSLIYIYIYIYGGVLLAPVKPRGGGMNRVLPENGTPPKNMLDSIKNEHISIQSGLAFGQYSTNLTKLLTKGIAYSSNTNINARVFNS